MLSTESICLDLTTCLMFKWKLLYFSLSFSLSLFIGWHWEKSISIFFVNLNMCLYTMISSPWAFPLPGENDLRCLLLYVTCSSPLIVFMSLQWTYSNMSVSLLLESPEPESAFYRGVTRTEKRARIAFLVAESAVCLMSPRCYCLSWAAKAQYWLIFSLFTGFLRSFSQKLLWCISWLFPCIYFSREFFLPRCRTWHLPLLNYIKFLFTLCSSLLRSLWAAAQSSDLSDPLPNFVKEQIDCTDLSLKNSR